MRAAAVCYRRTPDGVEFLLVRTRSRFGWTFPKGHLERGESPMQAAVREAKEEAGASGRVEAKPFTRYRLAAWTGTGLPPSEVCVEAHLMEVQDLGPQGSAERGSAWFTPELAAKKLAEGRPTTYGREHRRVIKEALARLQTSEPEA
jgi:8-oxo-dGTP pyrophosphatase MutT (NUDIX family)